MLRKASNISAHLAISQQVNELLNRRGISGAMGAAGGFAN
jgi:hypothetical protein